MSKIVWGIYTFIITVAAMYYFHKSDKLAHYIKIMETDDAGISSLLSQVLLEAMKKQHLTKDEVISLLTFYNKCLIGVTDSTDFYWRTFDYNHIDVKYKKEYDEIYYVKGLYLFLLFKKEIFVEYRYNYANRENLNNYLEVGGEYQTQD